MTPEGPTPSCVRRSDEFQVLTPILDHPPLDIHRIDQRVHSLHVGSSDERRLRNFLPKCHLSSDEDISTTDITIPPILIQGPITRSRAHQLKQQVNSFLCSSSCENENRLLPNDVLVLRNLGEDQQGLGKGRGVEEEQLGRPHRAGAQAQLDFDSTSESRSRPHQN